MLEDVFFFMKAGFASALGSERGSRKAYGWVTDYVSMVFSAV